MNAVETLSAPAACIDIGSNTTRLLVAEWTSSGLREIVTQRDFNQLGAVIRNDGAIPTAKVYEVSVSVEEQAQVARSHGAKAIRVIATAAVRDAENRADLLAAITARAGLPVEVLGPEQEARLAFRGATRSLPRGDHSDDSVIAVVDVGGGSSEVAVGTLATGVQSAASFRVGSGDLAARFLASDPPSPAELQAARDHVLTVFEGCVFPEVDHALVIGGTSMSITLLTGERLGSEELDRAVQLMCAEPSAVAAVELGLDPERLRTLPAGIVILREIGERLRKPLTVGGGGLREGIVMDLLKA